jgi:hypothetical protein
MGDWPSGLRTSASEYAKLQAEVDYKRDTYYENENFRVWLEEIKDQVAVHVVIHKFSASILKDIKRVWAEVLVKMYFLGYEEVFTYTKDDRIVKLIGGATLVGEHQDYEVWKWELN